MGLEEAMAEGAVRKVEAGEIVLLSGTIYTGRDAVHSYLHKGGELDVLKGAVIYHCGPVVLEETGSDGKPRYRMMAAGPTTSIREEPYQAGLIARYGAKARVR